MPVEDVIASIPIKDSGNIDAFMTRWGSTVYDYKLNNVTVDFQDLMVAVSEHRAIAVEGEVTPLALRMRRRNKDLERAGSLLAIFTKAQSEFNSDSSGGSTTHISGIKADQYDLLAEAYRRRGGTPPATITDGWANSDWTKSSIEGMVQALKSMIDEMNNKSQSDMTRMQSLVDRRDESYTTATTLMTNISETRDNAIRNL